MVRVPSQSYPEQGYGTAGPQYAYQFDAMGRTSGITGPPWNLTIATAAYGPAGQLTSLNGDTRTYNILGQLTRINGGGIDLEYVYTAGQNNGRITQQIDHVSGEQVTYQYDQLNRLSHAETLDNSWGLSYGYDGFGNLTAKTVTKGTAIPGWTGFTVAYDPATNHGNAYDANGNASVGGVYPYDVENRLTATIRSPARGEYYSSDGNYVYDPWGKRIGWRFPRSTGIVGSDPETKCEVYFYGVTGQKLASYSCGYHDAEGGDGTFYWSLKGYNVYFAGHLVQSNGVSVTTDRLGSVRANGSGERFNYLPHGEERTPTADGRVKFGTYIRDSGGLDYADQRYYDRGSGRFLTADPEGIRTAIPGNPITWNRHAYVNGDPANYVDRWGLRADDPENEEPDCYFNGMGVDQGTCYFFAGGGGRGEGSTPASGGGGGGYVQVQPKVPAGNNYAPAQMQALTNGLNNALSHTDQVDCATFYAGGDEDPSLAVANILENTTYRLLALPQGPGTGAQTIGLNDVMINTTGAFFNAAANASGTVTVGMPNAAGVQTNITFADVSTLEGFMLLHELGHQTGVFGADINAGTNGANSQAVLDHCFRRDAQGVYH